MGKTEHITVERWLAVPGYEGAYEVSDMGRVRSLDRVIETKRGRSREHKGQTLEQATTRDGHTQVSICRDGTGFTRSVHRIVLLAFVGPAPEGHQCRHLNGIPNDNRLSNLCWGTQAENAHDARLHGVIPVGESHHNSRLTADAVRYLRVQCRTRTFVDIARELGVTPCCVRHATNGRTWRHVK